MPQGRSASYRDNSAKKTAAAAQIDHEVRRLQNFLETVLTPEAKAIYMPPIDDGNAASAAAMTLLEQTRVSRPTQVGNDACSAQSRCLKIEDRKRNVDGEALADCLRTIKKRLGGLRFRSSQFDHFGGRV